ncbi:extracellular solute-binding protein [Paenibacillus rhizovicinus]|uniref:Extracellular solute-binding protein n=1 Tax=Paenibacillus rhizovicinus TaxID=2704463 RepID=A0A6C0P890_9BACL|nr:extracellular solute-binding protein [Paenibacillus rhizovicinus]QHW34774.1 extracellular solute-binding protein [Paenibacillus rhizovicinus]
MGKRFVAILFMIIALGSAAACSGNEGQSTTDANNGTTRVASDASSEPPAGQASGTMSVTYMDGMWDAVIPSAQGPAVSAIDKKFNIDFKPRFSYMQEYPEKLAVTMAGGELPDMIGLEGPDANFMKWAKQGAFLPLNDEIKRYPALSGIPERIWHSVTVDGSIYAIPRWFTTKYGKQPVIRQDWLDNLGLKMPTNYEELLDVLVAFAKDDPDRNGKNDTYGLGLSSVDTGMLYGAAMGVEWDSTAWYEKNDRGQLVPGLITNGNKEQVDFLAKLYAAGALTKDWAVSKANDVRNDFFSGKYGMYFEQPYDFSEKRFASLRTLQPAAKLAVIPPFKQDDGQSGFTSTGKGFYQMIMLNANLKDNPEKIDRILGMLDYMSAWIPWEDRNPQNPDFDWQYGGEGKGYAMKDGVAVETIDGQDLRPKNYLVGRYWAPNDEAVQLPGAFTDPLAKQFVQDAVNTLQSVKFYQNPVDAIVSPLKETNEAELERDFNAHVTRMIVGSESMANWDAAVKWYLDDGGQAIIDEVNRMLDEEQIQPGWG